MERISLKHLKLLSLLMAAALLLTAVVLPAAAAESEQPGLEGTEPRAEDWWAEELPSGATDETGSASAYTTETGLSVSCRAAILVDQDTGEVLFSYDPDEANHPASTTKLMTAYLCLKYGNVNDTFTVTSSALSGLQSASTAGMYVGETFRIYDLLVCMLLPSGCDAANVIAEYISGSTSAFVSLMNQEAAALGCTNTHFSNCHGVPSSTHYTTVADMVKIARAASQYETIRQIVSSEKITIAATNMHAARTMTNTNSLLPNSGSVYANPYVTGMKTGSSATSAYNAVFTAEKDGVRLLGVIYGAASASSRWSQANAMLSWGFENYHPKNLSSDSCTVTLSQTKYTWDGEDHKPTVTVTYDGTTLKEGTDYTLSYEGGTDVGSASVTVKAAGDYRGSKTAAYQIVSPMPFTDVRPSAWYWNAVYTGWQRGLVSGLSETIYGPNDSTTRGMTVTVL